VSDDGYVYHLDECTLALPEGFIDRSTHILEWAGPSGGKLALVVQRQAAGSDNLEEIVAQQMRTYASELLAYRAGHTEVVVQDGIPIVHTTFRWKSDEFPIYQHQAFLLDQGVVLAFTVTGRVEEREAVDALMERALSGLRLRAT
jgi:hypothetical protein